MLRTILIIATCSLLATIASGQQKIGDNTLTLDPASLLELESTSQGFLPSRLTSVQRDAQTEWDEGHIIYNITDNCLQIYNGSSWDCFVQGVTIDSSIYKYNGALATDRVISMNGKQLTFDGSGDVVITDAGFIGIGEPIPEVKLHVGGGTVKLSDYGSGTNIGSESYLLGVDSDGDVIEVTPAIDTFLLSGDTLMISLKGDGIPFDSVVLSGINTDDQILDSLGFTGSNLEIAIEGDVNGLQTLDLSSLQENIYNTSDSLEAARVVTMDGNSLTFDGTATGDMIIEADGDVGIGTTAPNARLEVSGGAVRFSNYGSGSNTGTETYVLGVDTDGDVIEIDAASIGENIYNTSDSLEAARVVTMDGNSLTFDGTATGDMIIEADGDVGIGTTAPGARLEVDGGSVIFDDYGVGTYNDTTANYILATDTSGAVVELNTAKNTRWFYPPPVIIDASSTVTAATYDVHAAYVDQFTNSATFVKSSSAGHKLPVYLEGELGYFVTFYDDAILDNVSISDAGVLTYDIISIPDDNYTVITIVFEIL